MSTSNNKYTSSDENISSVAGLDAGRRLNQPRVSLDLISLTYGVFVAQLVKDYKSSSMDELNKKLDEIGSHIGIVLVDDYVSKHDRRPDGLVGGGVTPIMKPCRSLEDVVKHVCRALKIYMEPHLMPLTADDSATAYEKIDGVEQIPATFLVKLPPSITTFVQLPEELSRELVYCQIVCGAIRAALAEVQWPVRVWVERDALKLNATGVATSLRNGTWIGLQVIEETVTPPGF